MKNLFLLGRLRLVRLNREHAICIHMKTPSGVTFGPRRGMERKVDPSSEIFLRAAPSSACFPRLRPRRLANTKCVFNSPYCGSSHLLMKLTLALCSAERLEESTPR